MKVITNKEYTKLLEDEKLVDKILTEKVELEEKYKLELAKLKLAIVEKNKQIVDLTNKVKSLENEIRKKNELEDASSTIYDEYLYGKRKD